MNDLEICKRLAEIEKLNQVEINGNVLVSHGFSCDRVYNPLKNDALCFQLMVKYDVCRELTGSELFRAVICNWKTKTKSEYFRGFGETLNKAICLAIIAAHK